MGNENPGVFVNIGAQPAIFRNDLKQTNEFSDITLATEDRQYIEAHKVILVPS